MPRLLWLMFQVPISSPQITRMLGVPACAWAGRGKNGGAATTTRAKVRLAASFGLMPILLSQRCIADSGSETDEGVPAPSAGFACHDSCRARARMAEVDLHDPLATDDAYELARGAVHEDQHDEPELDGPEVWPYDLAPEMAVGLGEVSTAPPERDEVLQVVHEERGEDVDGSFPEHVVDERLVREAVDEGQLVRDEHDFGHEQRHDCGPRDGGELKAVLAQHQRPVDQHDVKRDQEEDGGRKHLQELVLQDVKELGHGVVLMGWDSRGAPPAPMAPPGTGSSRAPSSPPWSAPASCAVRPLPSATPSYP